MNLELARMGFLNYATAFALVAVCFLLIVIVLLQRGRGGGISSAFGGGGSSAFGSKTGDVFTWITVGFAAAFLLLAVLGNYVFRQEAPQAAVVDTVLTTQPASQPAAATSVPVPESTQPAQVNQNGADHETSDSEAADFPSEEKTEEEPSP